MARTIEVGGTSRTGPTCNQHLQNHDSTTKWKRGNMESSRTFKNSYHGVQQGHKISGTIVGTRYPKGRHNKHMLS